MPRTKGTTTARGYGRTHQVERQRWAPAVARGIIPCARCGLLIRPGQPWDLDHADDRGRYLGPSCTKCNRAAGARKGNARRGRTTRLRW